jgi:hypothetical protein
MRAFGKEIDERFWTHRRRSTSIAGTFCAVTALVLFEYRLLAQGHWSWDLLAVGLVFVIVKLASMVWFHLTD